MNGVKEYLMHHDPERWVDIDQTRDGYLMLIRHWVSSIAIGVLLAIVIYSVFLA